MKMNGEGLFTLEDISRGLEDMGIPFKIQSLKQPAAKQIFELYKEMVRMQWNVTEDELKRPRFQDPEGYESMSEFYNGFLFLNVYDSLSRMLGYHGRRQCELKNIINPTEQSVREITTILFNFARFRIQKLQFIQEEDENRKRLVNENESLRKDVDQVQREADKLKMSAKEKQQEIDRMGNEIRELQKKINDTENANKCLEDDTKKLIEQKADKERQLNLKRQRSESIINEVKRLQRLVSRSSDEVQAALNQAIEKRASEMQRNEAQKQKFDQAKEKLGILTNSREQLISLLDLAAPITRDRKSLDSLIEVREKVQNERKIRDQKKISLENERQAARDSEAEKERAAAERREILKAIKEQKVANKREEEMHERSIRAIADEIQMLRQKVVEYADNVMQGVDSL